MPEKQHYAIEIRFYFEFLNDFQNRFDASLAVISVVLKDLSNEATSQDQKEVFEVLRVDCYPWDPAPRSDV